MVVTDFYNLRQTSVICLFTDYASHAQSDWRSANYCTVAENMSPNDAADSTRYLRSRKSEILGFMRDSYGKFLLAI